MAGPQAGEATPVSIVLYVHNGEPYLEAALAAIQAQTHERFELCVVDDGSTDGTAARLTEAASHDDRIRVQHQPARGRQRLHETVNAGLAMAQHELIVMANADDIWHPTKLERQLAAFAADPQLDICTHDAVFIDDRGRVLHGGFRRYDSPYPSAPPRPWQFIAGNPIPNPTTMFRRGILRRIGLQEVGDMHDHQFWFKAVLHGCRFHGLPDRLLRYRLHEGSHSTARSRKAIIEQTRRECAVAMAGRYGLDRLVPELAAAGDDTSRAWAASFIASEFWRSDAVDAAEHFWRMALRCSDDAAILTGLGMCHLRSGDEASALELLRTAVAAGCNEARLLSAAPSEAEHAIAPIWNGTEPPIVDLVRSTDRTGFDLGTDSCPEAFDHVAVVDTASIGRAPGERLADWLVEVASTDVTARALLVLDGDVDLAAVEAAHAAATDRLSAVTALHVEVDLAPSDAHTALVSAHRLDGSEIRRIGGDPASALAA
jgi:hypothetical protein